MATFTISSGANDAQRRLSPSYFTTDGRGGGVYNMMGRYDSTITKYGVGLRFTNVTIPQGATINSAYVTFKAQESDTGATCSLKIRCEKVDNSAAFSDSTDFDSRILTSGSVDTSKITSSVSWSPGSWTANTTYDTASIVTPIQEIVNRSGWASGNAICVFVDDFENNSSAGAFRIAWDRDAVDASVANSAAPVLTVTYDPGASITAPALAASVSVPSPGVTVTPLFDLFTDSDATSLASHTPSTGGSWAPYPVSGSYSARIASNRAHSYSSGLGSDAIYTLSTSTGNDFDVRADIVRLSSVSAQAGLLARASTGATTFYNAFIDNGEFGTAGKAYLYKYVAGSATLLGSYDSGSAWTGTTTIRFTGTGSSLAVYINGTSRITATDSAITSGYCGIRAGASQATIPPAWASDGLHLDNFQAQITGAATTVAPPALAASVALPAPTVTASSPNYTATVPPLAATASAPAPVVNATPGVVAGRHVLKTSGSATMIEDWTGDSQGGVEQNHNAFPMMDRIRSGTYDGYYLIAYQKAYTHGGANASLCYTLMNPDPAIGFTTPQALRHPGGSQYTGTFTYGYPDDPWWGIGPDFVRYLSATGEVMVAWLERHLTDHTTATEGFTRVWGAWFDCATSTWSAAQEITGMWPHPHYGDFNCAIELPNGDMLGSVYYCDSYAAYPSGLVAKCVKSTDHGRTWTQIGTISTGFPSDETAIIRYPYADSNGPAGQLVAIQRAEGYDYQRRYTSTDNGATWSGPTTVISSSNGTGWYGFTNRPELVLDENGVLWTCCRAKYGSNAGNSYHVFFRSTDRGQTWVGPTDPYTMATPTAGLPNETTRGWDVSGDFALTSTGEIVHVWAEAQTYSGSGTSGSPYVPERSRLYFRVLTETSLTPALTATASLPAPAVTTSTGSASATITAVPLAAGVRLSAPAVSASSGASPITAPALAAAVALPSAVIATTSGPPATAFLALVAPLVATTSPVADSPERRHRAYRSRRRGGEW